MSDRWRRLGYCERTSQQFIPVIIGSLLLLFLGFERIPAPLPIKAAAIPGYTLLAVVVSIPVFLYQQRLEFTPLTRTVLLFVLYMLVLSVFGVILDVTFLGAGEPRIVAWIRQVVSLSVGCIVFLLTRETVGELSDRRIIKLGLIAAVLPLLLGLLTTTTLLFDVSLPGTIADTIRKAFELRPLDRASGLSLEPSHFGYYIAVGVSPLLIAGFYSEVKNRYLFVGILAVAGAFLGAASITSAVVMAGLVGMAALFGPKRRIATGVLAVLFMFGILLPVVAPQSYPARQLVNLVTGDWNLSITTRFWSTFGPLRAFVLTPRAMLGYGLGGTTVHLPTLVPPEALAGIRGVTYDQMPNLNSMLGRILADGGVIGGVLFVLVFLTAFRQAFHVRRQTDTSPLMLVAPMAIGAIGVGACFAYGSFALPFLWFWLGLVDQRYIDVLSGIDFGQATKAGERE